MLTKQESSALFIACSHVIIDQGGDEMYNIYCLGEPDTGVLECFGEKYDLTGDISQANVLVSFGADITEEMLGSKLIFAVLDCSYGRSKLPEEEIVPEPVFGRTLVRSSRNARSSHVFEPALPRSAIPP